MGGTLYRIAKWHARRKFNHIDMVAQCLLWNQLTLGNYVIAVCVWLALTLVSVICEQATGQSPNTNPHGQPSQGS